MLCWSIQCVRYFGHCYARVILFENYNKKRINILLHPLKQQNIKNCTHSSNVLALKSPIGNILILLILLIIVIIALYIIKDM